jgi:hypothetical protein
MALAAAKQATAASSRREAARVSDFMTLSLARGRATSNRTDDTDDACYANADDDVFMPKA